ncbi:forespore capture DNA-binding protein RefZ [Salibacterium aidingense]|uniref:forespore capture DNA-binding protein RefZ n=1 Tax=Salibacterium aidingense TaxID=384933 RepID=UPI0003F52C2D|nr:forespore capture DNA-binding protein RefZ [Salibacterium aidingense]
MDPENTRGRILEAAAVLFTNKGFHGTSVREIAKKTGVNLSLISYYFGGKQGLLEALMVNFLEGYIKNLEEAVKNPRHNSFEVLMEMAEKSLFYMQKYHLRARFVLREMTLDSTFVREITTTYLMKEKHLYAMVLKKGMQEGVFIPVTIHWTIMHFRAMVQMPFLHHQYVREVFHMQPQQAPFVTLYLKEIRSWVLKAVVNRDYLEREKPHRFFSQSL